MERNYDVVVIGAGHAGLCSAISAAESGSKVLLIQDKPVLGGNASAACGVPPHGAEALGHNRNLRDTGILENIRIDFYCRYAKESDIPSYWEMLLEERCKATPNLALMLDTRMVNVHMNGNRIESVDVVSLLGSQTETIHGRYFIDGTGDGTLGYLAGAEFRRGRECKDEFGEYYLGQDKEDTNTLGSSIYGWAIRRDYSVKFEPPEWAIHYDTCESLAHRPHTVEHIIPRVTLSKDGSEIMFFWWIEWGGELDVIEQQHEIYQRLKAEMFGLWDHLKNHCNEKTKKTFENYELYKWSAQPMRRESRRLMGDYILSEKDVITGTIFEDEIGYGGWPLDDHPPMGIASTEPACTQLFISHPYTVPYRCCYSKNIDNMFMVGRCISVTHAALSTVRVMNTLGAIGEAIGVAAAMCAQYGVSPRSIYEERIPELKQRILDRDLQLLGTAENNERNLAHRAKVTVSSELTYDSVPDMVGSLNLKYDTAIQLPISTRKVDSLSVELKSEKSTEVRWNVLRGNAIGHLGREKLAEGLVKIRPGTGFYELLSGNLDTSYGDILTVVLEGNPDVSWIYGNELTHTRWGVAYEGDMNGPLYHGVSIVVNDEKPWIWINNHGRIPAEVAAWTDSLEGYKRHSKVFITPHFRISPVQAPYGGENLTNGIYRFGAWTNTWISKPGLPQTVSLIWKNPIDVSRIELIFDTNLDYSDQRYGFPRAGEDYSIPDVIKETVSDYKVTLCDADGNEFYSYEVSGNMYRRNVHELPEKLKGVSTLLLDVTGTRGVAEARVFGIKVY